MNPLDDNQDETRSDEAFATLLGTTAGDAVPPDRARLAQLRTDSTAIFAAATPPATNPLRRSSVLLRTTSWLAAAAALLLLATAGYEAWWSSAHRGPTLGEAIANSERAATLHFRVRHGDEPTEIWHTRHPARVRWDTPQGSYRSDDAGHCWLVDEPANRVQPIQPPAGTDQPLRHFLAVLGLDLADAGLLEARPVARRQVAGQAMLVYQLDVAVAEQRVPLQALVSADTGRLHALSTPTGTLTVLDFAQPSTDDRFTIADTLTEDGRIGAVVDVQGIVTVKPVGGARWTPVRPNLVLRPGDWIRTDARGANATALRLAKQTGLILGPKSLVELRSPTTIRLVEGEIEVAPTAGATVRLLGPDATVVVQARQRYRARDERLVRLEQAPAWLLGFKGATAHAVLGSLVALVDSRQVPLSVGYHKVAVDIRDQLARTVIEESFVNHTDTQLEGVFQFPLPADASISGFGMWIDERYVEADIVEKQRAREIFETILRERRDPALLEWSGGNLFKARVWPILPHSEKRLKITYTQVLPLQGNRYRYHYPLVSELLRQHPLRELNLDVKISSAVALKSAASPTHTARLEKTARSAHLEFSAQDYTPTRDFEVVVEVADQQPAVVLLPHRRGDDGYFMLQITPPAVRPNTERRLVADGEPLQLLILADTSASIDAAQRSTQAAFVGTLLATLGPKDSFNLATCDVTCDWAFADARPATAEALATARAFLARRPSLGWTDLDRAFAAALQRAGPKTHIVYVGDGIVTTGTADPVAFAQRLRTLYGKSTATLHAVSLGSSYEAGVLKAIAALGRGSLRKLNGEATPQAVAQDLLGELAEPALRDLKVEFKGIQVARLLPEPVAPVAPGTQQLLLGRYLPGPNQTGEVVVTGTQGGKTVRYRAPLALADAAQGNSFIPRLWARLQLEHLLEQGATEAIRDEIIALSEEYQLITPYTSLLVLESDADRERFKVNRRFSLRDGERFFAEGHDRAVFELTQQQVKRAGEWRTALRRVVLRELSQLGRNAQQFQERVRPVGDLTLYSSSVEFAFGRSGARRLGLVDPKDFGTFKIGAGFNTNNGLVGSIVLTDGHFNRPSELSWDDFGRGLDRPGVDADEVAGGLDVHQGKSWEPLLEGKYAGTFSRNWPDPWLVSLDPFSARRDVDRKSLELYRLFRNFGMGERGQHQQGAINVLFPPLPAAPSEPHAATSSWPAEARALARSLLRREAVKRLAGGVEIVRTTATIDPRWGERTGLERRVELAAPNAWLTRLEPDGEQALVTWCDGREVGVFSAAFQLGQVRAAQPGELGPPLTLDDLSLPALEQAYPRHTVTVEPLSPQRSRLILQPGHPDSDELRLVIDTARHVALSLERRRRDRVVSTTTFTDFVETAGGWWAQRIETTDAANRTTRLTTLTVKDLPAAQFTQRLQAELAPRTAVQFVHSPLPSVAAAKRAVALGKAGFDEQFTLLLHARQREQWPTVFERLAAAEARAPGKPGLHWLRSGLLFESRRHEELRQRFQEDAARLALASSADALHQARYVVRHAAEVLEANEMLALLNRLRPLFDRQPAHTRAGRQWQELRLEYLTKAGRTDDGLLLHEKLATDYPHDADVQQEHARLLAKNGAYPAAYAWLKRALGPDAKWAAEESDQLRSVYAELLAQEGRTADVVQYLAAWVAAQPERPAVYEQYLGALLKADQLDKTSALALGWLKEAQAAGALAPAATARAHAAIRFMQLHPDARWLGPLAEAALASARQPTRAEFAEAILGDWQFRSRHEGQAVCQALARHLLADRATLPPEQLQQLLGWVSADDLAPAEWQKLATALHQRWAGTKDDAVKRALGDVVEAVLSRHGEPHGEPNDWLAFLRLRRQTEPAPVRDACTSRLFEELLAQPWSDAVERELCGLLGELAASEDAETGTRVRVGAAHRLTDGLLAARLAVRMAKVEHAEKLTRTELRRLQAASRRLASAELADRLRATAARQRQPLAGWLLAESVYLDVQYDRHPERAAATAWEQLGAPGQADVSDLGADLRQRWLTVLMNLAARRQAGPELVDRLLKYLDEGSARADDRAAWQLLQVRLLIALDRRAELERVLTAWARDEAADSLWRVALGYLYAEQGRVADAVRAFEAIEKADELEPAEVRALADWYRLLGRRDDHERAALAVFQALTPAQLDDWLTRQFQAWQRDSGRLPAELDRDVLRAFAVLFARSPVPHDYLPALQRFYAACQDARLLTGLADAVVGHSAGRVYPILAGLQPVLSEIHDEATVDAIVARIGVVRKTAARAVDQRALDLLEALVERRAAELKLQSGPHRERARAALVRAGQRAWSPGEPRLMATLLKTLGKLPWEPLAVEQRRQLAALLEHTVPGTQDRLYVAHQLALTLTAYGQRTDGISRLQTALDEFAQANDGVLPVSGHYALAALIGLLEDDGQLAAAEQALLTRLERVRNHEQRQWQLSSLHEVYLAALQKDGTVSLGKGLALYPAFEAKLRKELLHAQPNQHDGTIARLCRLYSTAHQQGRAGVAADLHRFAFGLLPSLLPGLGEQRPAVVDNVAVTIRQVAGPAAAVRFLVTMLEAEPPWQRLGDGSGLSAAAAKLASWRREAKDLGDVEPRLLRLVLAQLRHDLETGANNRLPLASAAQRDAFWPEKADDFARVAEDVLALHPASPSTVQRIARYFDEGLGRPARAIEILFAARQQQRLGDAGQDTLATLLQREQRFAESIPVLVPRLQQRPANLDYRVQLMDAYFRTGQAAKLRALQQQTDAFFRRPDRWSEAVLVRLADSALRTEQYEQAVAYYQEAIALRARVLPRPDRGSDPLSAPYLGLSTALTRLKRTAEAVDAASAALINCGPRVDQRAAALAAINHALATAPDLDAYRARLDSQPLDSAVLRRALGEAYRAKGQTAEALKQLEVANRLQPNDAETRRLLLTAYDEAGDQAGALRLLQQAVQQARLDLTLYHELGERLTAAGQPVEAERAYTSIVEVQPAEPESHTLLAEVRERQERWTEAIAHWEQVVRLRPLEPIGLLKLAAALLHEQQWEQARATLHRLEERTWPDRFGDVARQTQALAVRLKLRR